MWESTYVLDTVKQTVSLSLHDFGQYDFSWLLVCREWHGYLIQLGIIFHIQLSITICNGFKILPASRDIPNLENLILPANRSKDFT
jgi:hypothetical protein